MATKQTNKQCVSPLMVIKLKLLFPETMLSNAKVDLLNDVQ